MTLAFPNQFADIGRALLGTDKIPVNDGRKTDVSRFATYIGAGLPLYKLDPLTLSASALLAPAGTPTWTTGTFGTVAKKVGTTFTTPTAGHKIAVTTDALALFTVTFAGTETTPAAVATAINAAAGVDIAQANPWATATSLLVASQIAGNSSSLTLANNTGTPLADIFGGGYAGSTITGVTSAPSISVYTSGGVSMWRMQATGMGATSSANFLLAAAVPIQDVNYDFSFAPYDGITQTSMPIVYLNYAADSARHTAYSMAGQLNVNTGAGLAAVSRNDGTSLCVASATVNGYSMQVAGTVRAACVGSSGYPSLLASVEATGSTASIGPIVGSSAAAAYGAPWTTGSPPYPDNNRIGFGISSAGTSLPFPIDVRIYSCTVRAA